MSDSKIEFAIALGRMQAQFATIEKKKTVDTGKFKYDFAPLEDILDYVRPLMFDHGFSWYATGSVERLSIEVTLLHQSGYSISSAFPMHQTANPKDLGSEISYLRRYGIVSLLGLATGDDDDGAAAATGSATRAKSGAAAKRKPKERAKPKFDTNSSEGKVTQLWMKARQAADAIKAAGGEEWSPEDWVRSELNALPAQQFLVQDPATGEESLIEIGDRSTKVLTTDQINALIDKLKAIIEGNTPPGE